MPSPTKLLILFLIFSLLSPSLAVATGGDPSADNDTSADAPAAEDASEDTEDSAPEDTSQDNKDTSDEKDKDEAGVGDGVGGPGNKDGSTDGPAGFNEADARDEAVDDAFDEGRFGPERDEGVFGFGFDSFSPQDASGNPVGEQSFDEGRFGEDAPSVFGKGADTLGVTPTGYASNVSDDKTASINGLDALGSFLSNVNKNFGIIGATLNPVSTAVASPKTNITITPPYFTLKDTPENRQKVEDFYNRDNVRAKALQQALSLAIDIEAEDKAWEAVEKETMADLQATFPDNYRGFAMPDIAGTGNTRSRAPGLPTGDPATANDSNDDNTTNKTTGQNESATEPNQAGVGTGVGSSPDGKNQESTDSQTSNNNPGTNPNQNAPQSDFSFGKEIGAGDPAETESDSKDTKNASADGSDNTTNTTPTGQTGPATTPAQNAVANRDQALETKDEVPDNPKLDGEALTGSESLTQSEDVADTPVSPNIENGEPLGSGAEHDLSNDTPRENAVVAAFKYAFEEVIGIKSAIAKPLGLRNNNPTNIRKKNIKWEGKVDNPAGGGFETFETSFHGLRAGFKNMHAKRAKESDGGDGKVSIAQMIPILSPPKDNNNTAEYVRRVAARTGLQPNERFSIKDEQAKATAVMKAIIQEENSSVPFTEAEFDKAFKSAFGGSTGKHTAPLDETIRTATTEVVKFGVDQALKSVGVSEPLRATFGELTKQALNQTGNNRGSGEATQQPTTGTLGSNPTNAQVQEFWSKRNPRGARLYSRMKRNVPLVDPKHMSDVALGIEQFEKLNPRYRVEMYGPSGGFRSSGSTANHGRQRDGKGSALDLTIIDKRTGKMLTNHKGSHHKRQGTVAGNAPVYQTLYNEVVIATYARNPNRAKNLRFGGYFGNYLDTMHIDTRARIGSSGGSTLGGFTNKQMRTMGIKSNNPLGSWANVAELARQRGAGTAQPNTESPTGPSPASEPNESPAPTDSVPVEPTTQTNQEQITELTQKLAELGIETTIGPMGIPAQIAVKVMEEIMKLQLEGVEITPEVMREVIEDTLKETVRETIEDVLNPVKKVSEVTKTIRTIIENLTGVRINRGQNNEREINRENDSDNVCMNRNEKTQPCFQIPVRVTYDADSKTVDFSSDLFYQEYDYPEEYNKEFITNFLEEDEKKPPLVFSDEGSILYSDGRYAPYTINGNEVDTDIDVEYTYTLQVLKDGELVTFDDNADVLPGNYISRLFDKIRSDDSPYDIEDVMSVRHELIDPDQDIPADEYYLYEVELLDGSLRTVHVPKFTSYLFLKEQFEQSGYRGNVLALTDLSLEVAYGVLSDKEIEDQGEQEQPNYRNEYTIEAVKELNVYLNVDMTCPNVPGLDKGYIYELVVYQYAIPGAPADGVIQAERCGTGTALTHVAEINSHLQNQYGFAPFSNQELLDKTTFNFYNGPLVEDMEVEEVPSEVTIDPIPTSVDEAEEIALPNTTNTIIFEVRTSTNNGTVLQDWRTVDSLVIGGETQLDFRWDGSDYRQCLPFLADNGEYVLTRNDGFITAGDTALEDFDVRETTTSYYIECAGQENGESGVDVAVVEVEVK